MQRLISTSLLLVALSLGTACALEMDEVDSDEAALSKRGEFQPLKTLPRADQELVSKSYSQKLAGRTVKGPDGSVTKFSIEADPEAACWAYPGNIGCWFGDWLVSCERNANTNDEWDCGVAHHDDLD